jgi:hypothetical protein
MKLVDRDGSVIMSRETKALDMEWTRVGGGEMEWLKLAFEIDARERGVRILNPDYKTRQKDGNYEFVVEYLGKRK